MFRRDSVKPQLSRVLKRHTEKANIIGKKKREERCFILVRPESINDHLWKTQRVGVSPLFVFNYFILLIPTTILIAPPTIPTIA